MFDIPATSKVISGRSVGQPLVIVPTHGDFIVLPHWKTRPSASWSDIPLGHIIPKLSQPVLAVPNSNNDCSLCALSLLAMLHIFNLCNKRYIKKCLHDFVLKWKCANLNTLRQQFRQTFIQSFSWKTQPSLSNCNQCNLVSHCWAYIKMMFWMRLIFLLGEWYCSIWIISKSKGDYLFNSDR